MMAAFGGCLCRSKGSNKWHERPVYWISAQVHLSAEESRGGTAQGSVAVIRRLKRKDGNLADTKATQQAKALRVGLKKCEAEGTKGTVVRQKPGRSV